MYLLEVLNPVAQLRGVLEAESIKSRPPTLEGKTVGLLWNGYTTGDEVLKSLGETFGERFTDARAKFYIGGHPTPAPVLERAAEECDVVVGGFAD